MPGGCDSGIVFESTVPVSHSGEGEPQGWYQFADWTNLGTVRRYESVERVSRWADLASLGIES